MVHEGSQACHFWTSCHFMALKDTSPALLSICDARHQFQTASWYQIGDWALAVGGSFRLYKVEQVAPGVGVFSWAPWAVCWHFWLVMLGSGALLSSSWKNICWYPIFSSIIFSPMTNLSLTQWLHPIWTGQGFFPHYCAILFRLLRRPQSQCGPSTVPKVFSTRAGGADRGKTSTASVGWWTSHFGYRVAVILLLDDLFQSGSHPCCINLALLLWICKFWGWGSMKLTSCRCLARTELII